MSAPAGNLGGGSGRREKPNHSTASGLFPEGTPTASVAPVAEKFDGTSNPRHCRIIALLKQRPAKREEIDRAAGASNGPDAVLELRRRGLEIPCVRVPAFDRDGRQIRIGVYALTDTDRRKITVWLSRRQKGHSEVAVVAAVFVASLALAWLAETIVRWLA